MLRVAEQYAATDTGLQRRANEDSLLARAPLFVVADGMGGAQAGEVASRIAVESFRGGIPDGSSPERSLADHALAANRRIHDLSQSNAEQAGMGTTLTALYVGEEEIAVAQVGDSRAYCVRDGEMLRLTDDHSLVDELIRQGRLTPEEAVEHPQRSIITRALGPEASVEVDTRSYRARPGDVYLLCSDGLTTMLSEQEVLDTVLAHTPLNEAGEALIAAANEAGGRDNITVVLLRLEEVTGASGAETAAGSTGQEATSTDAPVPSSTADENTIVGMRSPGGASEDTLLGMPPVQAPAGLAPARPSAGRVPPTWRAQRSVRPPQARVPATRRDPRAGSGRADPRRAPSGRVAPGQGARSGRLRLPRLGAVFATLTVLGVLAAGGYLATQSLYFIGTNQSGLVSIYNGLPVELPGGMKLYTRTYVSGVPASTIAAARRHKLLDDSLHSETEVIKAIRRLELSSATGA